MSAAAVRLVVCDVDGVLTRGTIPFDAEGRRLAVFHARDGLAVQLARAAGIEVAVLSGARSAAVLARAAELGIRRVVQGAADKGAALVALQRDAGCAPAATLYVGDDLNDLPAFAQAGIAVAPADAAALVRARAAWVTAARGGEGVLREIVERLLHERGDWADVVGKCFGTVPAREI